MELSQIVKYMVSRIPVILKGETKKYSSQAFKRYEKSEGILTEGQKEWVIDAIEQRGEAVAIYNETLDEVMHDIPLTDIGMLTFKTPLPVAIITVKQAKEFLTALYNNDESYHPEDRAKDIVWDGSNPTKKQCKQLDKLMRDIYNLNGNSGNHATPKFDPCGFLLSLDTEQIKNRIAEGEEFKHVLSGNIITVLQVKNRKVTLSMGKEIFKHSMDEIVALFRCGQYSI